MAVPPEASPSLPSVEEARRFRKEALASGDHKRIADAEMWLGAALFEDHLPAAALVSFQDAAAAYDKGGMRTEVGMARLNQARVLSSLGRNDETIASYEDIGSQPLGTDDPLQAVVASAWYGLAEHHERLGDTNAADAAIAHAAELAAKQGEEPLLRHDHWVAHVLYKRGDPSTAARYAELARRYAAAGSLDDVGNCLLSQGAAHHEAGEVHQALDAYQRALAHYERTGNQQAAAATRHNIEALPH